LLASERLGVAMSVQLDELFSLRRHEEASRLLRGRSLARDLDGVLKIRAVDELAMLLFSLRKRCAFKDARIAACSGSAGACGSSPHCIVSSIASASASATYTSSHSSNHWSTELLELYSASGCDGGCGGG
jgi:hypothetical protein